MNKKLKKILFFPFRLFITFIKMLLFNLLIISIITLYGVYISYNGLTTSSYEINNNKLNDNTNIVLISDLHNNKIGKNNNKLIKNIKSISPDLILVAGDMLNDDSENSKIVTNFMKKLSKDYKVFYSLGNAELDYISLGTSDLVKELENSGVTVLHNEYEDIVINGNVIRIGGMYDYAFGLKNKGDNLTEPNQKLVYKFLSDFEDTHNYKIMLSHRPDSFIFNDATKDWDIDLVVSGHTHGGQVVIPFVGGLYVGDQGFFPEYDKGRFNLNNTEVIITSGLGSGKQILPRFNNIPEVIDIKLN